MMHGMCLKKKDIQQEIRIIVHLIIMLCALLKIGY